MKWHFISKTVTRGHLLIKVFLAFIAGTVSTDSMNGIYAHYFNMPSSEFVVRPQFAFLGIAFIVFVTLFILFGVVRGDKDAVS